MGQLLTRHGFDFETIGTVDDASIRFLPIVSRPNYWVDGRLPIENNFKCSFTFNASKARKLLNAVQLPERKFVKWRGKRMLVSKTSQKSVTISFTDKQYKDISRFVPVE